MFAYILLVLLFCFSRAHISTRFSTIAAKSKVSITGEFEINIAGLVNDTNQTKLEKLKDGIRNMIAKWLGYAIPAEYIYVNIIWVSQTRWKAVGVALCHSCLSAHGHDLGKVPRRRQCKLVGSDQEAHGKEGERQWNNKDSIKWRQWQLPFKRRVQKKETGVGLGWGRPGLFGCLLGGDVDVTAVLGPRGWVGSGRIGAIHPVIMWHNKYT